MTRVTLSQLLCVPTVRIEKSGSVSVWHNDSADAIFIGCCWNISLPWRSPVKNKPAVAASATQHAQDGRRAEHGRGRRSASAVGGLGLCERTIHHALTAGDERAGGQQRTRRRCAETPLCAVLLVSSAPMLVQLGASVAGL